MVSVKNTLIKLTCQIRLVTLDVTDRCNQHCNKCLLCNIQPFADMTFNQFETLLGQLPGSVRGISWAGMGEPLINSDTPRMIQLAHKEGYKTTLYTNGTIPHGNLEGYIDEVVYNAETLLERNIIKAPEVSANYVLQESLQKLNDYLNRTSMRKILVSEVRQMYPGATLPRHSLERVLLTNDDKNHAKDYASQKGIVLNFADTPSGKNCIAPWCYVNISHNLQVTPCCLHQHPAFFKMGEITEKQSLTDIWRGTAYKELRKSLQNGNPSRLCKECGKI